MYLFIKLHECHLPEGCNLKILTPVHIVYFGKVNVTAVGGTAQVVFRWPPIVPAWVQSQVNSCEICKI
jgi:hypothetical protein